MENPILQTDHRGKGVVRRLDRATEGVNAVLLVFAIGLAMLDFTCFCAFEAQSALPSIARTDAGPPALSQVAKPEAPLADAGVPRAAPPALAVPAASR